MEKEIKITKKEVENLKNQRKEKAKESIKMSKESTANFKKIAKEVNMPIKITDNDFGMGKGEIDIRDLSKKNLNQLAFRQQSTMNILLKDMTQSINDLNRLVLVLVKKLGSGDIVKDIEEILQEDIIKDDGRSKHNN